MNLSDKKLKMSLIDKKYAVCRLDIIDKIPEWSTCGGFFSITRTSDELSIVCCEDYVADNIKCEKGWRILKVEGPLEFSLTGILSAISTILASNGISIFAVSTYDTDFILVKDEDVDKSIQALTENGYEVR
jgi:uncharacterized protein